MQEFEPKLKRKRITKVTIAKYIYVLVIGLFLMGGISYSYTFFNQNKKIASGSIKTAGLNIEVSNRDINVLELGEYKKVLEINNKGNTDGIITLKLSRESGLNLNELKYGIIIDNSFQIIDDVPLDGKLFTDIINHSEKKDIEIVIWSKLDTVNSFVGRIDYDIKYLGSVASNMPNIDGKYVSFNCSDTCEIWQIVKVEDGRVVLTRQDDYDDAINRINSNRYNPDLVFNDNSLITSVSTDNKNVYLAKTVRINDGEGTLDNPYILYNKDNSTVDKKIVATIIYKDNDIVVSEQNIYYNVNNYVSKTIDNINFKEWTDGTNTYKFKDNISINNDIVLNAVYMNTQE